MCVCYPYYILLVALLGIISFHAMICAYTRHMRLGAMQARMKAKLERLTRGPRPLRGIQYPKVQVYVLMGTAGSYTDFHIDFGGLMRFTHHCKYPTHTIATSWWVKLW